MSSEVTKGRIGIREILYDGLFCRKQKVDRFDLPATQGLSRLGVIPAGLGIAIRVFYLVLSQPVPMLESDFYKAEQMPVIFPLSWIERVRIDHLEKPSNRLHALQA